MVTSILRLPAVKARTGLSRSTVYLHVSQGLWTKPVKIGPQASGWPDGEVEELIQARIAGKSDEEIRLLVAKLEADRNTVKAE